MINTSMLFLATEKTGGLFDFDGTLPVILFQFLLLMFTLNFVLYTPLLDTINERNAYISKSLEKASTILYEAKVLTNKYLSELDIVRKEAQIEASMVQRIYKEIIDNDIRASQSFIDEFVSKMTEEFENNKDNILISLEDEIDSLSIQIISKILI
uniref:AtpG n=1 Tax=Schizocladia ischiensis TaxID=196139 RepID=A0A7S6U9X5_9STRA|nr:AtpG [Schizocladia ischiensis]QOW07529.1 AtpG [Schizocladia ischiensis]